MSNGYYKAYKRRKRKQSLKSVGFLMLILFTVIVLWAGRSKVNEMQAEANTLQTRIETLQDRLVQERLSATEQRVALIKEQSDEFIEQKAREEFNLIKKGDRVYIITDE